MKTELESRNFIAPSRLFTDLQKPEARRRFKGLIKFQYHFPDERAMELMDNLEREVYWERVAHEVLALVVNQESERAFQVGTLLGYLSGKFIVTFGDSYIKQMREQELLLIKKTEISPQAGIRVRFLGEDWKTQQEGELVSYERVEEREQGDPLGWYIIQVGKETQRIADWGALITEDTRFFVEPPRPNDPPQA